MAKDLFIIRHAKSDWNFEVADFDRPLNNRGFINAPVMAERLKNYNIRPGILVSSPAKRALTTAQIFAQHLEIPLSRIQVEPSIYEAGAQTLLQVVSTFSDEFSCVALFGHNPGLSLLTSYLSTAGTNELPTCAIVHLNFPDTENWKHVSSGTGGVRWFVYPKDNH